MKGQKRRRKNERNKKEVEITVRAKEKEEDRQAEMRRWLCIPKTMQQPVLHEAHDAPAGGHFGADWRYLHMKDLYFQKNLQRNTQQYIADYNLCHQTNNRSGNPMGLLQTFPVAKCHWQRIGIDFITDLAIPETEHDCLILFVDHMATGAYWPACSKTIDTLTFALIFIDDIVRRYGVPQKAV